MSYETVNARNYYFFFIHRYSITLIYDGITSIINTTVNVFNNLKQRYHYSLILLRQLVITDFKLRYKGSALGYVWTLLRPLALFAVLYVVFVRFLRVGDTVPHFAVYLLLGIVLWNYFVEVTNNGLSAIVGKGDLFRKLDFPRYVVVVAGSFSALINLAINLLVIALFMVINGVPFSFNILWLVPLIVELFVFALALAFILSALYVRFRDINYIWEVMLQAGFYATPILYPISLVVTISPIAAKLMMLNPAAQIIQDARYFVVTKDTITLGQLYASPYIYLVPVAVVTILAVIGVIYFKKKSPGFAEEI
ncbi:ABC transporter permease [Candidatus Saccharibacteria bacterium]|nr:ABC transporter permease [Candidatus Saccharibacteria bacterium]